MFEKIRNKLWKPAANHWKCKLCTYVFYKKVEKCPYCKGEVIEVHESIGQK